MAMEKPLAQVEMIEVNEFYENAMRYNVDAVPQTNYNEGVGVILGVVPLDDLLRELKKTVEF